MPVDHENKIAFVHIPRTGGKSLCEYWPFKVECKHEPVSWYRKQYPGYFLFTIYRPFRDRVQSAHGWRLNDSQIDDFINNPADEKEYPNEYFMDEQVDLIIDYKDWDLGIWRLREKFGLPFVKFKRINSYA